MSHCFIRKLLLISNILLLSFTGIWGCAPTLFPIGGNVSGLSGTLVLQNNGGNDLSLSAEGAFIFSTGLPLESAYSITVLTQPSGQTCTVTNGEGVVSGTVSDVTVTCSGSGETFTLGGTVSGLVGTVVLENTDAQEVSVSSDGAFVFATALANGSPYSVTVKTQPENPHQACVVANGSGSINSANVENVSVSCTDNLYTVTINLQTLAPLQMGSLSLGIDLEDGGANLFFVNTGTQTFQNSLADGVYALTIISSPTLPHQTCSLMGADFAGGNVTIDGEDVTVNANCSTNDYTLSVNVAGLADGESVTVASTVGGVLSPIVSNGAFDFPDAIADQTAYTVSISQQPTTQTCTLGSNASGTIDGADVEVDVTCVNTYSVGGSISGLSGTVILQNNGGNSLSTASNGAFSFSERLVEGASYSVTVFTQPSGQTCSVTNGSGTMGSSNVTNVSVSCAANILSIFISSATYDGNLGGISGADAHCDSEFSGTKAMVVYASDRMACANPSCNWVLAPSTTYYRADGTTPIGTTDSSAVFPFPLDNSLTGSSGEIWTGLSDTWTTGFVCGGWILNSSAVGVAWATDATASASIVADSFADCAVARPLACVQQP